MVSSARRSGIGAAVVMILLITFLVGVVWIVLYYGMILPVQTTIGTGWSDSITAQFMSTIAAWWPFILLLAEIIWVLNQSNKQGLQY